MGNKPTKPTAKRQAKKVRRKTIPVDGGTSERDEHRELATLATSPEFAAYRVIRGAELKSGMGDAIELAAMLARLHEQSDAVNGGNLTLPEAMLMNQATALQTLFARLAERGMAAETATPFELNMRMALRAQSQCRATLETLATIKNPPVVYARQANVTTGPQQINNGASSQAREIESERSKLSRDHNELLQDPGASRATSGANPPLEAMAEIDRTPVHRG